MRQKREFYGNRKERLTRLDKKKTVEEAYRRERNLLNNEIIIENLATVQEEMFLQEMPRDKQKTSQNTLMKKKMKIVIDNNIFQSELIFSQQMTMRKKRLSMSLLLKLAEQKR